MDGKGVDVRAQLARQTSRGDLRIERRRFLQRCRVGGACAAKATRLRKRSLKEPQQARVAFDKTLLCPLNHIPETGGEKNLIPDALLAVDKNRSFRRERAVPLGVGEDGGLPL